MMRAALHPGIPAFLMLGIRRTWIYRMRFLMWGISAMLQLFLLRVVWIAVYGDRDVVNGIPVGTMVVFLTVAMLMAFQLQTTVGYVIEEAVQRGTIATSIVRPVGYLWQIAAYDLGNFVGRFPILVIAIPIAAAIGSLTGPPDAITGIVFVLSVACAYALTVLIAMMIGMCGFWTIDTSGMRFLVTSVMGFLSGAMVPLWFLPSWARTILEWLPFQGMAFLPVSIYVGQNTGADMWGALGVQIVWVVVLTMLAAAIWHRAQRKVVVQGG